MKRSLIILASVLALTVAVGCKKKKQSEGAKKAAAMATTAKKELGFTPGTTVAINMESMRKSFLYNMVKPKLAKNIGKMTCVKELLDTATSVVFLVDDPNKMDSKDAAAVAVLKGAAADKVMACLKTDPDGKFSKEKVGGKEMMVMESKGEKTYYFKASDKAVVFASKNGVKGLTPGKGNFGTGKIEGFIGKGTIGFKTGAIKGQIKSASGSIDIADGIKLDVTVDLGDKAKAEQAETQFKAAKAMPQIGDIVKKFSLSRSGSSLTLTGGMSKSEMQKAIKAAGPMLGGMMR